jgi:hypothetical protein
VDQSQKLIHNVMNLPPEERGHPKTQANVAQAKQVVQGHVQRLESQKEPLSETQQKELAGAHAALARLGPEAPPQPNGPVHLTGDTKASVDHKLQNYLLNPDHPVGGSKAKWYRQALGFTRENSANLARQLVFDPATAIPTINTSHGQKYSQTIPIKGENGRTIEVKVIWIRNLDGVIRIVTAPPPKKK